MRLPLLSTLVGVALLAHVAHGEGSLSLRLELAEVAAIPGQAVEANLFFTNLTNAYSTGSLARPGLDILALAEPLRKQPRLATVAF